MSFLLGLPATESDTVSPALRARGINMLRVSPCELTSYAIVGRQQALYKPYLSHLPHYMLAYCTQSKVDCGTPFVPCKFPTERILPFPLPGLSISYNGSIPAETLDMLKGIGYQELTVQKKKTLVFPVITREQARSIAATSPITTTPTVQNTINLSGLGALTLVLRLLSNLLHAHHYPAFVSDDTASDVTASIDTKGSNKRKGSEKAPSRPKRARSDGQSAQEDEDMEESSSDEEITPATVAGHWNAIPPPKTTVAWGSLNQLPSGTGLYVPYIRDLSQPDKQTITYFIRDFLLQATGSSVNGIAESMDRIKALMGNLATTEVGHQLAHLTTVIRIALQAQACAFPLFEDGIYEGCVIRGCQFTAVAGSQMVKPVEDAQLRRVIDSFGSHSSAKTRIASVMLEDEVESAFKVDWKGETVAVTSMYLLRVRLASCQFTQLERDEIVKAASHLRFGPASGCSPGSVDMHIRLLSAEPDDDRLRDLPIHPMALFSTDWTYVVWSSFGRLAPSPWYGNAPSFDLTKQPRPTRMFWELRALEEAVADMKKVQSTRRITVPTHKRKSSVYREMEWNSRQIKDILQALTRWTTGVDEVTGQQTMLSGAGTTAVLDDGLYDI